jgi:HSP20 family protein
MLILRAGNDPPTVVAESSLGPPVLCDPDGHMPAWPSVLQAAELGDLSDDVRRLFQELAGGSPRGHAAGDCQPPVDVVETDEAVEILLDVPGVAPESVRVLLKGEVVLIAGEKWVQGPGAGGGGYHLVERASGRFARAVRLSGAFDGSAVKATLTQGELRVTLPKLADRRGRGLPVPVAGSQETRS